MSLLEPDIQSWRRSLGLPGHLEAEQLDELEDHLRSTVEAKVAQGQDEREAFAEAAHQLGPTTLITTEFAKDRMTMTLFSRLLGIALTVFVLVAAASITGVVGSFLYLPALLFVAGVVVGGLWASFGLRHVREAFACVLAGKPAADAVHAERFRAIFLRGQRLAWSAGLLGALIGTINMLSMLGDPSQIGPCVALSMLSILYGALVAELGFRTLLQWTTPAATATS